MLREALLPKHFHTSLTQNVALCCRVRLRTPHTRLTQNVVLCFRMRLHTPHTSLTQNVAMHVAGCDCVLHTQAWPRMLQDVIAYSTHKLDPECCSVFQDPIAYSTHKLDPECCSVFQDTIAYSIVSSNPATSAFFLHPVLGNVTLTQSLLGTTINSYRVSELPHLSRLPLRNCFRALDEL